jgi:type IX secretion system PorP/SprF family membrane protein
MILCKRKIAFLFILLVLVVSNIFGQDAHYSQFYANPLYLNPAFAGSNNCPRFSINFRDQWPAIPRNYINFSGSYDQHINAIHGGIRALITADFEGKRVIQTYNASLIYNFRIKVTHKFNLQFALQGGYLTSKLNWEELQLASNILYPDIFPNIDGIVSINDYKKKSQFDAAFGFVGYTSYLYFGLAVHHLMPIQKNFILSAGNKFTNEWVPKWTAHIGGKITISQKLRTEVRNGDIFLYPNLVVISQRSVNYMHEGFYFSFYPLTIGAWLRHTANFKEFDAFIISCGIEYKLLRIGYSYDFSLSKLEGTGGAHEVSLQFTIPCKNSDGVSSKPKKKTNYPPVECPKF